MRLDAILQYNMNELETKAYKVCLLWLEVMDKELPDYHKTRLPKGDPRKSLLFKYCYKLVRETNGLIPDDQYKFYVLAQIRSLKMISDGKVHALIEPGCLVGEKAWRRWKLWKYRFEKQLTKISNEGEIKDIKAVDSQILAEFTRTKNFFTTNFGETFGPEDVKKFIENKDIIKWVAFSKVSPFYLLLSPLIKKSFSDIENSFSVDVDFYQNSITPEVETAFKEFFPWDQ